MEPYADVIIDLSVKNVDRIFQYRIPDHLKELVKPGVQVNIPFGKGNTERKGIVVGLSKETDYDPEKMKELLDVETGAVPIRTQMICLAFWMKDRYSTTISFSTNGFSIAAVMPSFSEVSFKGSSPFSRSAR